MAQVRDWYVTKPFSLEELVARLRNILRRSGADEERSSRLQFADLELDDDTREVSRAGRPIELTATEYRLLRYLLLNPRRVMTRAQLLDHVWSYDFGGDARVLETYISYLRKKLDVGGPSLLHTIRGVGYVLRLPRGPGGARSRGRGPRGRRRDRPAVRALLAQRGRPAARTGELGPRCGLGVA